MMLNRKPENKDFKISLRESGQGTKNKWNDCWVGFWWHESSSVVLELAPSGVKEQ